MNRSELAAAISEELGLGTPPIGVGFVSSPPPGMMVWDQPVPSACSFWRRAERETFYAPADRHFDCAVGALTMGFELPAEVQQRLMDTVGAMVGSNYLAADEPPSIPTVKRSKSGIFYGPLRDLPIDPDLVLFWMTPIQAMLYGEAVGATRWSSGGATPVLGRPACAALAVATENDTETLSLGCTGMRTFTEISDGLLLGVVPFGRGAAFVDALAGTRSSNEVMRSAYEEHKQQFAPTS